MNVGKYLSGEDYNLAMHDEIALYKAHAERSKEKRRHNRASSAKMLTDYGVPFTAYNDNAHIVIQYTDPEIKINFWPGTGLWRVYGTMKSGRGVRNLLNYIRQFATLESDH